MTDLTVFFLKQQIHRRLENACRLLQVNDQFRMYAGERKYVFTVLTTAVFCRFAVPLIKHTAAASLVAHAEIRVPGNMHDAVRFPLVDVEGAAYAVHRDVIACA